MGVDNFASLVARLARETGDAQGAPRRIPPVEQWEPAFCGEAGLEIRRDGTWFHEGTPFTRERLVRLFASILRKDADGLTYLVTPGEKIRIHVEDAPFLAVRAECVGEGELQQVAFVTNMGDVVALDADHPLRVSVDPETGEPRPYVLVRGRLEARIVRSVFYDLVEWGKEGEGGFGLWSGGTWWRLG